MDNFFDNLCRILATPMPRGRALKIIAGGLAGAVLAPFAFGQKKTCKPACVCSGAQQGGGCCSPGQTCFGNQICCSAGYVGMSVLKQNKTQITCVQFNASGTYPGNSTLLGQGNTCS